MGKIFFYLVKYIFDCNFRSGSSSGYGSQMGMIMEVNNISLDHYQTSDNCLVTL